MKNILLLSLTALLIALPAFGFARATPRYTLKTITLPGKVQLQYAEQGKPDGVPVIFLHGHADSWRSYEQVLPLLSDGMHAYVITQRGHGNSSKPAGNYQTFDFAMDLAAFMQQLHISRAFIAGHSLGARVAQRFALNFPERTLGLLLEGTVSSYTRNPVMAALRTQVAAFKERVTGAFISDFQKSILARPIDPEWLNALLAESTQVPVFVWKAVLSGLVYPDFRNELKQLRVPTLVLWGEKDPVCPRSEQGRLFDDIKGAELKIYANTGHVPHWEEPARYTADLTAFIQQSLRR